MHDELRQKMHLLEKKVDDEVLTISRLVQSVQALNTKIEHLSETLIDVKTKVNLLWRGGLAVLSALLATAWMVLKHHFGL